jgi:hypothetical protein
MSRPSVICSRVCRSSRKREAIRSASRHASFIGGKYVSRPQLWAEAVARYRQGAIWWFEEPELIALAKAEQDQRYQTDAWDERIDRWLVYDRRRVNHGYGNYDDWRDEEFERTCPLTDISVGEVLEHALGIEPARWTRADQMRVGAYLKAPLRITPIRRVPVDCCARAASGHAAVAPQIPATNRRLPMPLIIDPRPIGSCPRK